MGAIWIEAPSSRRRRRRRRRRSSGETERTSRSVTTRNEREIANCQNVVPDEAAPPHRGRRPPPEIREEAEGSGGKIERSFPRGSSTSGSGIHFVTERILVFLLSAVARVPFLPRNPRGYKSRIEARSNGGNSERKAKKRLLFLADP